MSGCAVHQNHNADLHCGDPVVGERAGFPMCAYHYELFDPAGAVSKPWVPIPAESSDIDGGSVGQEQGGVE